MEYSHREASRIHAVKRAWHRFGIAISVAELVELEKLIWAGKAKWIRDQPDMRSVYRLTVRGKDVYPVFDISLDAIVTFLPCEMWADRSERRYKERYAAG